MPETLQPQTGEERFSTDSYPGGGSRVELGKDGFPDRQIFYECGSFEEDGGDEGDTFNLELFSIAPDQDDVDTILRFEHGEAFVHDGVMVYMPDTEGDASTTVLDNLFTNRDAPGELVVGETWGGFGFGKFLGAQRFKEYEKPQPDSSEGASMVDVAEFDFDQESLRLIEQQDTDEHYKKYVQLAVDIGTGKEIVDSPEEDMSPEDREAISALIPSILVGLEAYDGEYTVQAIARVFDQIKASKPVVEGEEQFTFAPASVIAETVVSLLSEEGLIEEMGRVTDLTQVRSHLAGDTSLEKSELDRLAGEIFLFARQTKRVAIITAQPADVLRDKNNDPYEAAAYVAERVDNKYIITSDSDLNKFERRLIDMISALRGDEANQDKIETARGNLRQVQAAKDKRAVARATIANGS